MNHPGFFCGDLDPYCSPRSGSLIEEGWWLEAGCACLQPPPLLNRDEAPKALRRARATAKRPG
ncbi:hypothetical protein [Reticulibacter mediterranei]|uniref:hypothetical protein n=1 Tax=Reticulibacter mediterranei TaxID=2778369 RepID=UPI001C68EA55|nr:hypothetical protein [Reticulibacter mediterranei]